MTLSAASVGFGPAGPVLQAAAPLPIEALVLGKPVAEVAELLPRLFNLCRSAQAAATRLALGLPPAGEGPVAEIIRDHVLKLCVVLPRAFGLPVLALPRAPVALLGAGGLPRGFSSLWCWESPLAPMVARLALIFPAGVAVTAALLPPPPLALGAFENSAAGRRSGHPLLAEVEARFGRGPLWRYLGLAADLEAALQGALPEPACVEGIATAPAARGSYALRITQSGGLVTGITRRTPTDHLLAPGGALLQALASLPPGLRECAPQVIALHDPCVPVTIREVSHA